MTVAPYRYRIVCENTVAGVSGKGINVYNVGNDVLLSDAAVTNILTALKAFYNAQAPYLPGTYSIGARVLEFRPGAIAPRIVTVAAQGQTNGVTTQQAAQLAGVVAWRTALAGRRYRGRTFLGPLNAAAITAGALAGVFLTAANNAAATLVTAVKAQTSAGWGMVVHSDEAPDDTPIVNGVMSGKIMTIRSRN